MGKIATSRKDGKKNTKLTLRDWEEIRFKAILGETLASLAKQYDVPYQTVRNRSMTEKWDLHKKVTDKESAREYRRALVDKNYSYINIYSKIRKKVEEKLKENNTVKDLNLLTQITKTIHEQELLCFALRGDENENT